MSVHPEGQQDNEGEAPDGQQRVGQHSEQGGGWRGWLVRDWGTHGAQRHSRPACTAPGPDHRPLQPLPTPRRSRASGGQSQPTSAPPTPSPSGPPASGRWVKRSLQKLPSQQQKYTWGFSSVATHSCLEARFPIHNSAEGQIPQGGPANPSPQTEIPMGNCGGWAPRKRDPGSGGESKGGRPPPASLGTSKPGRAGARREPVWTRHPASGAPAPVVAVEVVQPAAFLDELDGARAVAPGGVAVQPLVLLALAALQAALVGALQLPVGVVVDALPRLGLPAPRTCARGRELPLSRPGPWGGGGAGSDWQPRLPYPEGTRDPLHPWQQI